MEAVLRFRPIQLLHQPYLTSNAKHSSLGVGELDVHLLGQMQRLPEVLESVKSLYTERYH